MCTLAFTSAEVENVEWPHMHGMELFVIIETPELEAISSCTVFEFLDSLC